MPYFRCYTGICMGMQKTPQILGQDSKFEDRRTKPGPPEHEAATVLMWPDSRTQNRRHRTFWRCIQVTGYSDAVSKWTDILTLYPSDRTFWRCIQVTGHSDAVSKWPDILTLYPSDRIFWSCIQVTGHSDGVSKWPDILTLYPNDLTL
jgi:hypothetical protein